MAISGLATEMFGAGFDPSTGILPPRVQVSYRHFDPLGFICIGHTHRLIMRYFLCLCAQAFEHSEVRMLAPSDIWSVSVRPFEQLALDRIQSTGIMFCDVTRYMNIPGYKLSYC